MIRSFDEPPGKSPRASGPKSLLRSIERALAAESNDPSDRAQELFYDALDASTDEEELKLLQKALKLDTGNVDVLLALFRHQGFCEADEIEYLQKLVALAEMRLGPEAFKEFAGAFWGFHETRPYMRARQALAEHLRAAGRVEEAVMEYSAMLELNPGDNQGVRYSLLPCLLILQRLAAVKKLFASYPQEYEFNAVFAWGRVLQRFLSDDVPGAAKALVVARKQNRHLQAYLKGNRRMPKTWPEAYSPGSKEEAICFADVIRAAWKKYPAALEWLDAQKVP